MTGDRITAVLLPATLAIAGWNSCLPVSDDLEHWLHPVQLVPGLFLDDAVLIGCFLLATPTVMKAIARGLRSAARPASMLLAALAAWCVLPGLFGPAPTRDPLESCKLAMNASLLLAIAGCGWSVAHRSLRWMLVGMAAGTLVNLFATFTSARPVIGTLPMLLGQNGPGTAMGLCVCLAAFLAVSGHGAQDALIAIAVAAPATAGAAISYSKIGMSSAALGWFGLAASAAVRDSGGKRVVLRSVLAAAIIGCAASIASEPGREVAASLSEFVRIKMASMAPTTLDDPASSNSARIGYLEGTLEIMSVSPVGVGFSGFNAAIRETRAYREGRTPEEIDGLDGMGDSNPHATPLYYASAGGWAGLLLALGGFAALLRCVVIGAGTFGAAGKAVALTLCATYTIMFLTVPTLYRTKLLICPAGMAVALRATNGDRRRSEPR